MSEPPGNVAPTETPDAPADPTQLTPKEIVRLLDDHIIGQDPAKRAVAIAVRNRWRRRRLAENFRRDVAPKNILMIGPTGVGKTEIARRLARLTGAPFIKVEATKYTEVGYYGRDVESMVRELVENAISLVRDRERKRIEPEARARSEQTLLDLLSPQPEDLPVGEEQQARHERSRERLLEMLHNGVFDERRVTLSIEQRATPMIFSGPGVEHMDMDLQGMLERFVPKNVQQRELSVKDARQVLFDQECEALIDSESVNASAIELAEELGIIFIDEIDKVVASESKSADVSRQGVQRDLLPIVEGATVQTRYGSVSTHHVLFVAAGAFHRANPSDLMPELQGRFPIRVELTDLTKEDFVRILTEPASSLTRQYEELMRTEGVELRFEADAIESLAEFAFRVNQSTQNIGARRLYTVLERVLEDLSFDAPERRGDHVSMNADYVHERLEALAGDDDLGRYIL